MLYIYANKLKTLKNGQRNIIQQKKKSNEQNPARKTWIDQKKVLQLIEIKNKL